LEQDIKMDILLPKIQARTQSRVFRNISEKISSFCCVDAEIILRICKQDSQERFFSPSPGLAILDMKSKFIKTPVSAFASLATPVTFESMKGQAVDLVAVIISPASHGAFHLQRLAPVSRMLADEDLCNALRGAEDEDAMQALFFTAIQSQSKAA